jgi:hypothetical protein
MGLERQEEVAYDRKRHMRVGSLFLNFGEWVSLCGK